MSRVMREALVMARPENRWLFEAWWGMVPEEEQEELREALADFRIRVLSAWEVVGPVIEGEIVEDSSHAPQLRL